MKTGDGEKTATCDKLHKLPAGPGMQGLNMGSGLGGERESGLLTGRGSFVTTEEVKDMEKAPFEPRLVGFLCNWCSYAGADLAGVSRLQYPPNVRIVRVMCSGRVDPLFVLRTLVEGADGVLVSG